MDNSRGISLYNKAKKVIPGGTQLLSKRPEMFLPDQWPSYYESCEGVNVIDLDGNEYIDMTIFGVGACVLGYADKDVDNAVKKAIKKGTMCTLNCPEEVELADILIDLHPWSQMVRYARCGGEAMAIAVRIARSLTGKEKIIFCGYHGWHDWYLSSLLLKSTALDNHLFSNLKSKGMVSSLAGTSVPFKYNNLEDFKKVLTSNENCIAAVVMEPVRNYWPKNEFIEEIRQITFEKNIPLIFDEITSGFRMSNGGIHLKLRIEPDIAIFAKALGNGYPMAAIIGKEKIMKAAQDSFISSTYWTERIGPVAGLATIKKFVDCDVSSHLVRIGKLIQDGWRSLSEKYDIKINITGIPPLSHWEIKSKDSRLIHTLIVKLMLEKGFLTSNAFYASYAHNREHIDNYLKALDEVLEELIYDIKNENISKIYCGTTAHKGLMYLN